MKKFFSILLAVALVGALTACGSGGDSKETTAGTTTTAAAPGQSEAGTTAAQDTTAAGTDTENLTLEKGVFKVGMEIGYPPMEYLDTDGSTPIGFDVDLAKAIGEKLGLEVELINTAWDGIFASLDSERYDCVMSAVSITEERQQNYNMTKPYIKNKLVIVTGPDSNVTKPEELKGLRVVTQTETTADIYMNELMNGGLEIKDYGVYDQVINCFDELKLGRADAVMVDSVVAAYYINGADKENYKQVWESDEGEPIGICLKKGNDALTKAVEDAVDALYADGTIKTIAEKHFGTDLTEGMR